MPPLTVSLVRVLLGEEKGAVVSSGRETCVGNIRCGGNNLRLGFYAVEWSGGGEGTIFVLSRAEDH